MRPRSLLTALPALLLALNVPAQVRVSPGASASAPALVPALQSGLSPSFSAPSFSAATSLSGSLPAASLAPVPGVPAPLPALAASVVPAAAAPVAPAGAVPAALTPRGAAASKDGGSLHSFSELRDWFESRGDEAGAKAFDGAAPKPDGELARPVGSYGVSTVRVHSAREAAAYIPASEANARSFVAALGAGWGGIGWLDLRFYRDSGGNTFRAVDLSGRPDLIERLPEVLPHEAALVKKIQLHVDDLQLVLREEGKTPDLIVGGVVTEMKSLHADGLLGTQLEHADAQLLAHSKRHGLGLGAVAIDVVGPARDWSEIEASINEYAGRRVVGFARVEVYNGGERRVFVPARGGRFAADLSPAALPRAASSARFRVPNSLVEAPVPDPQLVLREVMEPSKRLRAAGVKATITVYGSARILPPDVARAKLAAILKRHGGKPKSPEARRLLHEARIAVQESKYYEIARQFGALVAENGGGEVAVVTGGGPGIMEAANRGAFEKGGPSVGYNIILDHEQGLNDYVTPGLEYEFQHFATRKMALRHGAMALVYFPGGFGTMDELFEVLTLMQTRKMKRVPIVLIGEKGYWDKIIDFEEFARRGLISPGDLSMFTFADTAAEAWRAAAGAPPALTAR